MGRRYDTISFLSDYGADDEFVGVVHSVVRGIAPHAHVVDITHGIGAHDVRAGGLALARSAQYLCPGVVLAVVDPGVGTDRRAVAVEVGGGESVLVGPDNGLLAPAVAMVGGADRAVSLTDPVWHLPAPGSTFDGRDVFAPVAAHLATGVDLGEMGDPIQPAGLLPGVLPVAAIESDGLHAEVLWVDRFGNLQLNVDPGELDALEAGDRYRVRVAERVFPAQRVSAYDDVPTGGLGVLVDSWGMVSLVVARASAAADLGIGAGGAVVLGPAGDDPGVTTRVTLGGRSDSDDPEGT
ncbi:MAG: SAM-dependent chlorinase/fluorinase [Acidimicrobiales bacterium]|nr:SAM-dependent chlorinase/fluorinase [Acidimicrobiales bacterium]